MNHPYLTSTLISAGSMLVGTSALAIQIDTFADDPSQIVASESAGGIPSTSPLAELVAFEGSADRSMVATSGTGVFGTLGIIGDGVLQFANTPESAGTLQVQYLLPLDSADLTDGFTSTGFLFTIDFADAPVDLTIKVEDLFGSNTSTFTTTLPTGIVGGGDEQEVFIPFASLTGTADLTDTAELNLTFSPTGGVLGADLTISDLRTGVPEPSSLALIALGGLAMMRRRRA